MNIFSPWPEEGEWFKFIRRPSYHVRVGYRVDHDEDEATPKEIHWQFWARRPEFKATYGRWWFFSLMLFGRFGFYIGFKPINLQDPNFEVPKWFSRGRPACEFSMRWTAHGGR